MKKQKTMRSLLVSLLSLMMCVTMLVGSTFAWFTDSVTSANNIITSGNLDVELYYATEYNGADTVWTKVDETTKIFNENALYEPGYTEVVFFKVENKGSLNLEYNMSINFEETAGVNKAGQSFSLSDYLRAQVFSSGSFAKVSGSEGRDYIHENFSGETLNTVKFGDNYRTYVAGWNTSKVLAPNASYETALTLFMPTTVGNEANHNGTAPEINLGISLVATQTSVESDDFGHDYDAFVNVADYFATPETVMDIIHEAQPGAVIKLESGHYGELVLENADGTSKDDITIIGNGGNGSTFTVGSINLNSSTNVTLTNIYFDIAKAQPVYEKDGSASGYVSNIIGAKSGAATGAKDVVIDGCTFNTTSSYDSNVYVPISFEEQGRPTSRATNITIINCKISKECFDFARLNYMADGTILVKKNSIVRATKHNILTLTGNAADLTFEGNYVFGWATNKAAIGSSRQGTNFINFKVTGNTFRNSALTPDEGRIVELKSSYKADDSKLELSGNTYEGSLSGMTDETAPVLKP